MTPLERAQVLHPYVCQQFGYEAPDKQNTGLPDMLETLKDQRQGEWEILDGQSNYARALCRRIIATGSIREDKLWQYDRNIIDLTRDIGMDTAKRSWKPFQYLVLLFTEYYLDRYFADADRLRDDLEKFREEHGTNDTPYTEKDLRTLAVQSATGSGKTLLLHANIKQYMHYLERAGQHHSFNKIILVTPDERMSGQHLRELTESGFEAGLFRRQGSNALGFMNHPVDIIEISKLKDADGPNTFNVDSFEENNLVLVDEGHLSQDRDNGKGIERQRRQKLAHNGFTFEYSATFNQITGNNDEMRDAYGKNLIFDYSYKHFYNDGYGKDYNIHNLHETDGLAAQPYLLACLLQFYQQRLVYDARPAEWEEFNPASPLLVFLGNTVTAGNKSRGQSESDVTHIVNFLGWVMSDATVVKKQIENIIKNKAPILDENRASLFRDAFPKLKKETAAGIYRGLLEHIFNGRGQLKVVHATQADEIHLRAGDAEHPFGVINVGDTFGLFKKLTEAENAPYQTGTDAIQSGLFDGVDDDAWITTVIGAQKFAAGWSSWRVSTMGLLNVGQTHGPQIIQMFGRGVRLKGRDMTLKRHAALGAKIPDLDILETLNIFGLRANYMTHFRKYLERNGITPNPETIELPVTSNFGAVKDKGLKVLCLREDADFRKSDERVVLRASSDLANNAVTMNLYASAQTLAPDESGNGEEAPLNETRLEEFMPGLLDKRRIHETLLERKNKNKWDNLEISTKDVDRLLADNDWFTLKTPSGILESDDVIVRTRRAHNLLTNLAEDFFSKLYRSRKRRWESGHMELVDLKDCDSNFISEYVVSVDEKEKALIDDVKELIKKFEKKEEYKTQYRIGSLLKGFHGYKPLLYQNKGESKPAIKIEPVPLNEGEKEFVELLAMVIDEDKTLYDDIFLLRNKGLGKGYSFFLDHGGYYPDFILWVLKDTAQHIVFIDPKGLKHIGSNEIQKFDLHRKIKDFEFGNNPEVQLHSYIWSVTPINEIPNLTRQLTNEDLRSRGIYLKSDGADGIKKMLENALNC